MQKILMVEDDTDIQLVARLSLEAVGGYTVEVCSGGQEALQKIAAFAPDLVLLDVMMPDMDGPTILQHLRADKATSDLPIVFMTAKAQAHEIAGYLALGAIGVISKPFDPMTLPATLSQIWEENISTIPSASLSPTSLPAISLDYARGNFVSPSAFSEGQPA